MTKTTNYQLNQWDEDDYVRRTDFNADNAKIDAALKMLTTTSAVVTGSYTGTGEDQTVSLGFQPSLMIIWAIPVKTPTTSNDIMGGIFFAGSPALLLRRDSNLVKDIDAEFLQTGIKLTGSSWPNLVDNAYYYAAFY